MYRNAGSDAQQNKSKKKKKKKNMQEWNHRFWIVGGFRSLFEVFFGNVCLFDFSISTRLVKYSQTSAKIRAMSRGNSFQILQVIPLSSLLYNMRHRS